MLRLAVLLLLHCVAVSCGSVPCRFSTAYTQEALIQNETAREQYLLSAAYWEGHFHQPYISYNPITGMTYDGTAINYTTGAACSPLHTFSAPSKEAIHVAMLLQAILGDPLARLFVSPDAPANASAAALSLLAAKIASYEAFNASWPGFGGFLPWVSVFDNGTAPLSTWANTVPSLDNGELAWSLFAVSDALQELAPALAARFMRYFRYLASTALSVFYSGDGCLRTVATIRNVSLPPAQNSYSQPCPLDLCCLDDPYEGELFAVLVDLYAPWQAFNYSLHEREKIWRRKRAKLQAVEYDSPYGPITVQRGWWFSSHESWKYLELPYQDVDVNWRVFLNGERARTCNSARLGIPGLYASVNDITSGSEQIPDYLSANGVGAIAFEPVVRHDVVTPYAAFPVLLANATVGLAWYHAMLAGGAMQGPHGSTEACAVNGTDISPVVTWDSKVTTLLAMTGGISALTRTGLQRDGTYDRFVAVIDREWTRVFPKLKGEDVQFCVPIEMVPRARPDFKSLH